jgi:chromosome segregation ATPase
MKPDTQEPADLVNRLRQQLILAQVRIMELEDARDSLAPRVAELDQLLQAAQALADRKSDECAHLENVLTEAQSQGVQLRQLQQQASGKIAAARAALAEVTARLTQRDETVLRLEAALRQLDSELQTIKTSRSWRWTAWLRKLGGQP